MVQIFVKVNGSKVTPMEVNLADDKVEDVMRRIENDEDAYVTMQGKVLKRHEKLKSCGVSDGCTIQVTSRLRGGGRHKDRKSQKERKQAGKQEGPEQKTEEEPKSDKGPATQECDKEAVIRILEENEGYRKIIKMISEGSDEEYGMQCFRAEFREKSGLDANQMKVLECGVRWAVEARRKERREEQKHRRQEEQEEQRRQGEQAQYSGHEQSKQGKQVRFGDDEQFEEVRTESADKLEETDGLAEVRTGRGSAGLVRGGDERFWADESNRKGKGKGNGGKGEHGGKGEGFGSKGKQQETREGGRKRLTEDEQQRNEEKEEILRLLGEWQERETSPIVKWAWADETEVESTQQVENSVTDEEQENKRTMTSEEKEKKHWEEVRKLLETVEKEEMELEMMLQEEMEHEEQRGRVAPNMGAGGSHPQATSDPRKKKKETRVLRWADREDDEGKEEEEQEQVAFELVGLEIDGGERKSEVEGKKEEEQEGEEETEGEKEQEQEQKTREEKGQDELTTQKPPGLEANEESEHEGKEEEEQRRAKEAREEERSEQEAREEQRRAQEAQGEEKRAQDAQEGRRAQEERENEAKAQEERKRAEAQDGHEGNEVWTTREECVEEKKETNSMQEKDVSNRHMAWWKNAWWIRVDSGPHMRTARGRRRVWRAARRAAEQARNNDGVGETQSLAEEAEGEKWRKDRRQSKQSNEATLHIVLHLQPTATAPAAAAGTGAAVAATRLQ